MIIFLWGQNSDFLMIFFPHLDPLIELEISQYNEAKWCTSNQPEIFVSEGMKYAQENKVFDGHGLISSRQVKSILS
jgi:hypothetical protein